MGAADFEAASDCIAHTAVLLSTHCRDTLCGTCLLPCRALQRLSVHRPPEGEGEAGEPQQPDGSGGLELIEAHTSWVAPLPPSPHLHTLSLGFPPSLARHSAPLPTLLRRLSSGRQHRPAPDDSGPLGSPFEEAAAAGLDPADVAAAAAAAAVGPGGAGDAEKEDHQRSITRLMGEAGRQAETGWLIHSFGGKLSIQWLHAAAAQWLGL